MNQLKSCLRPKQLKSWQLLPKKSICPPLAFAKRAQSYFNNPFVKSQISCQIVLPYQRVCQRHAPVSPQTVTPVSRRQAGHGQAEVVAGAVAEQDQLSGDQ